MKAARRKIYISLSSLGLLIFIICICAAAGLAVSGYMPYRSYRELRQKCDMGTTAVVYEKSGQVKDEVYYYGPKIQYNHSAKRADVRTEIINTVKLKKPKSWKKNSLVVIVYSSSDASLAMIDEDTAAEDAYKAKRTAAIAVTVFGAVMLVLGIAVQIARTRPKKYDTAPDGSTFEEWAQKKQLEAQAAEAEEKLNEAAELSAEIDNDIEKAGENDE